MPKAKRCHSADPPSKKRLTDKEPVCIIHDDTMKETGSLVLIHSLNEPIDRFNNLIDIRNKRLACPIGSPHRQQAVCNGIPSSLKDNHGYHANCNRKFTSHLDRISETPSSSSAATDACHDARRKSGDSIIFRSDCIFCNKTGRIKVKVSSKWVFENTTRFEFGGGDRILITAEANNDEPLLCRIRGHDLFACEAQYHRSCCRKYTRNPLRSKTTDPTTSEQQFELLSAHEKATEAVINVCKTTVLGAQEVVLLSNLKSIYIEVLRCTNFPNDEYQSKKLKQKLLGHQEIGDKIGFAQVKSKRGPFLSDAVYATSLSTPEAIGKAYELASCDPVKAVALEIRTAILEAFSQSPPLQWPPDPAKLGVNKDMIPDVLFRFLSHLLVDKPEYLTSRSERILLSIGQDICRSATNGEWKLDKHIMLCVTLRHLFRSKQLITIVNRLGHCENNTFASELELAISSKVQNASSLLTPQIVRGDGNVVFHSDWDNFNQLLSTLHGNPMCNTAGGIMLQEVSSDYVAEEEIPNEPVVTRREMLQNPPQKMVYETLPQVHVQKKSPDITCNLKNEPQENISTYESSLQKYFLWIICRSVCGSGHQQVPAFAGFISATGKPPTKLTTIDYYPMINEPITDFKVIKEILKKSQKATEDVGQKYVFVTFDLGVVMKAMPILWERPLDYPNHIVMIGPFHTTMNYLKMIGHKVGAAGYSEILIEANLVTNGTLKSVLSGKNYSKSLWCLKVVSEALERLLFKKFIDSLPENSPHREISVENLNVLIQSCSSEHLLAALEDNSLIILLQEYTNFQTKVKQGDYGKTAMFWYSFLEHARRVFMLMYAVKCNNLQLFHKAMCDMADLFFAFGGHNYSRYLTWFDVFLRNLDDTHPGAKELLQKGVISVARSWISGNLSATDKTVEETFMHFCKAKAGANPVGITGLLTNYAAYQQWIRTSSERAKYFRATLDMCGLLGNEDMHTSYHPETRAREIYRSEQAVQRAITALEGFLNPFEAPDKEHLLIISSGNTVPPAVEIDALRAEGAGRQEREMFMQNRLSPEAAVPFFTRIKKLKLLRMDSCNKRVKLSAKDGKLVQYQEQGDVAFQLLVKSQLLPVPPSVEEIMAFPLTPVSHALGTPDGFMAKTAKSKLMSKITADFQTVAAPDSQDPNEPITLFVQDGNAQLHALLDVPAVFEDICLKILDQLPRKADCLFATDMYHDLSTKSQERLLRGQGEKITLLGIKMRRPADFKMFLQNEENKLQLFDLLLKVWSSPAASRRIQGRTIMLAVRGKVYALTSADGLTTTCEEIHALYSNQEETDTRVVLYTLYAQQHGYQRVVHRSPDSDIFHILLYYSSQFTIPVLFDTGTKDNRNIWDMTDIGHDLGHEFCEALLGLHVFTGEDTNCAFKGKGKVRPLAKMISKPAYQAAFRQLGRSWDLAEDQRKSLERFTCFMYGYARLSQINDVRVAMIRKMVGGENHKINSTSKVDLSKLPPCKISLSPHLSRVNYRLGQWKRAHENTPEIPSPLQHGWVLGENRVLEPIWSDGPILPELLIELLPSDNSDDALESEDEDGMIDMMETYPDSSDDEDYADN